MESVILFLVLGAIPVAFFVYLAFLKKDTQETIATEEITIPIEEKSPEAEEDPKGKENQNTRQPVEVVVSVRLLKKVKGRFLSAIASIITIIIWALCYVGSLVQDASIASVIHSGFVTNPINMIGIAALVSSIGWWFKSSSCMILSGIALVAAVLFDWTTVFVLVPAVMFFFSSIGLSPKYYIETTTQQL